MNSLDRIYQTILLEKYDYNSILGGKADSIHHMLQGKSRSIRWYVPMGIPLTQEQHNEIHNDKGEEYIITITSIKGVEWMRDLHRQKNKIAKYLKYDAVKDHILGLTPNYV